MAHSDSDGAAADRARELMNGSTISVVLLLALAGCAPQVFTDVDPYGVPDERAQWEIKRTIRSEEARRGSTSGHASPRYRHVDRDRPGEQ